ncbi:unnamed protein product [Amoebophrya sp. A120]|nr:unnamed protein product [Amoebophrya sp. A120]|eukprot:GSA120T00022456001.1
MSAAASAASSTTTTMVVQQIQQKDHLEKQKKQSGINAALNLADGTQQQATSPLEDQLSMLTFMLQDNDDVIMDLLPLNAKQTVTNDMKNIILTIFRSMMGRLKEYRDAFINQVQQHQQQQAGITHLVMQQQNQQHGINFKNFKLEQLHTLLDILSRLCDNHPDFAAQLASGAEMNAADHTTASSTGSTNSNPAGDKIIYHEIILSLTKAVSTLASTTPTSTLSSPSDLSNSNTMNMNNDTNDQDAQDVLWRLTWLVLCYKGLPGVTELQDLPGSPAMSNLTTTQALRLYYNIWYNLSNKTKRLPASAQLHDQNSLTHGKKLVASMLEKMFPILDSLFRDFEMFKPGGNFSQTGGVTSTTTGNNNSLQHLSGEAREKKLALDNLEANIEYCQQLLTRVLDFATDVFKKENSEYFLNIYDAGRDWRHLEDNHRQRVQTERLQLMILLVRLFSHDKFAQHEK